MWGVPSLPSNAQVRFGGATHKRAVRARPMREASTRVDIMPGLPIPVCSHVCRSPHSTHTNTSARRSQRPCLSAALPAPTAPSNAPLLLQCRFACSEMDSALFVHRNPLGRYICRCLCARSYNSPHSTCRCTSGCGVVRACFEAARHATAAPRVACVLFVESTDFDEMHSPFSQHPTKTAVTSFACSPQPFGFKQSHAGVMACDVCPRFRTTRKCSAAVMPRCMQ